MALYETFMVRIVDTLVRDVDIVYYMYQYYIYRTIVTAIKLAVIILDAGLVLLFCDRFELELTIRSL